MTGKKLSMRRRKNIYCCGFLKIWKNRFLIWRILNLLKRKYISTNAKTEIEVEIIFKIQNKKFTFNCTLSNFHYYPWDNLLRRFGLCCWVMLETGWIGTKFSSTTIICFSRIQKEIQIQIQMELSSTYLDGKEVRNLKLSDQSQIFNCDCLVDEEWLTVD